MGLFKTYSEKEVKRVMPIVAKINGLEEEISKLSDSELRGKTDEFKNRLNKGETLDDILPEAFAVVREASKRVLGMKNISCNTSCIFKCTYRRRCTCCYC